MWFLLLLYTAHIEPVVLQGENRLILRDGSKSCEGHVEIYHNGKWGYVGDKYWSRDTEKVVCKSTHCGTPVGNLTENSTILLPTGSKVWLNEVNCSGSETNLWECEYPGWDISFYPKDTMRRVKCTNENIIRLDGFECAGAVLYSTDGTRPSGYFCNANWGQNEANILCNTLKCGTSREIPQEPWIGWKSFSNSKTMTFNCSGIENVTNLWQCAIATDEKSSCQNPASVICTGYKKLQVRGNASNVCSGQLEVEEGTNWKPVTNSETHPDVWCQQMQCGTAIKHSQHDNGTQLTCTDNVKVLLMDSGEPSRCYGEVYVQVNGFRHPVCGSSWTDENAEVVCRELNCGAVVSNSQEKTNNLQSIMDYVKCSGKESSLWHCRAKRDRDRFQCANKVHVVCAGSVQVRLVDGPGRCAGRVEIRHDGRWKRANSATWTTTNSDVVCRQLKCGNARKPDSSEKFNEGSVEFLAETVDCKKEDSSSISECIRKQTTNNPKKEDAVGITCEEHKMVFLHGNNTSCSGMVQIQQGPAIYWLSGSKDTWNQLSANAVCRQLECGEATLPASVRRVNMTTDVWHAAYSCSPNTTSLFDCEKTALPSDHNDTIATVTCSGKITVNLTEGCWGHLNICVTGECGGVCAGSWTDDKSVKLCKELGCGDRLLTANNRPKGSDHQVKVIFMSLHTTMQVTSMNQCTLVRSNGTYNTCNKGPVYVVCSGSIKPKIISSTDKCSGNVAVSYEGKQLPVCMDALTEISTQNTICRELKCGHAVNRIAHVGPKPEAHHFISKIQCSANGNQSLAACTVTSESSPCTLGGLQCSSWSKMVLKEDKSCSGIVFVHSQGKRSAVSPEGWTETEGQRLCWDLQCGNLTSSNMFAPDSHGRFNCTGVENPVNIWDCESQTWPSQQQQEHLQELSIECQDEPSVTLSKKCHGEVRLNNISVCDSHWNNTYSHLVCQEHSCSNAIDVVEKNLRARQPDPKEKYHHISCEDHHFKLGQCKRFEEKCEGKLVFIYCTDNIKFNTTEKCGGQIEVNYRNEWEKVCPLTEFPSEFKDKLCQDLGCGRHYDRIVSRKTQVNLETRLRCTKDHRDIKHCVIQESCGRSLPAEIYCDDYEPTSTPPPLSPSSTVPIILGVGFLLVLVILIVVFIRICIVKKSKKAKNASSRMLSRKEVEFESGDYEDAPSKANEMENFGRGTGFRSEAEVFTENDAQSDASFPYDDIDEATEARPLTSQTSQAAAAGASGGDYMNEDDRSADGATYEVDDPHENYDDIEASPEIPQTEVQVHGSPQTTPVRAAAASHPGLVQEGEDYLVPGQDG